MEKLLKAHRKIQANIIMLNIQKLFVQLNKYLYLRSIKFVELIHYEHYFIQSY